MQHKKKILIVDDNATNIAILEEALAEQYCLKAASSGEETLAVIEAFQPDLVLLDIMMPGIDGYETCRRIRANPALSNVKVIMVSAKAMVSERLKGYDAGADDYLTKPFEEEELLAKVRVYLRLKSVEEIDQLKSNLINLLNHETRTPLNGMVQPLELLMSDNPIDANLRKMCLALVNQSAQRLRQLFDKVIKLCAMKSGRWDYNFTKANLSELVIAATTEVAELASERDVKIDHQLEKVIAEIDLKEMKTVLKELLENAIRFSHPGGQVAVGVSAEAQHLSVNVTDHGDGIEPDDLGRVFDEFNQSDVAHHSEGHRLSLAIARQVAIAHAGTIDVASQKGRGTTFTVKLPLAER